MEGSAPVLVDHHTHVFSGAAREWFAKAIGKEVPPLTDAELVRVLEDDRVERAAVLSVAYVFARSGKLSPDAESSLRAENDFVGDAVVRHAGRLVGFFGVNPLADGCLDEVERCVAAGCFAGIKLHLANSRVDLRDTTHLHQLAVLFERANAFGLAVLVHMRTMHPEYGRADAEMFLDRVLADSSGVPVQVAHAAGWGGYDPATDAALGTFADRLSSEPSLREKLWFDLSAVIRRVRADAPRDASSPSWYPDDRYRRLASRIEAIGLDRVLFGTDWPEWTPRAYESDIRSNLPLTPASVERIVANRAPWLA